MTAHRTALKGSGRKHRAICECGWKGRFRPIRREASDDAQMHRLEKRYG